jgi:hypothetical protein
MENNGQKSKSRRPPSLRMLLAAVATCAAMLMGAARPCAAAEPLAFSGIYPHLAYVNDEGECGTGAVVPWADRLWVITYAPHKPEGSSDKLYEISPDLRAAVRPESIGGTPANRMIHRESGQLFIGPYAIDEARHVRAIPYASMFGRPTGNARHLFDPAGKIYYATMEEGFYEVDVKTLAVTELFADEAGRSGGQKADLPGYHGKGLYSGQGVLVYANNGDHAREALSDPRVPSGVLAEWDGKAERWTIVRRNQFTEVTGPGGILGNSRPETDPIWSVGWDARSVLLMLRDGGRWQAFRLPKATHTYDGAHGWNTEWPRIRDIGPEGRPDLLMNMHGMFYSFPIDFRASDTSGIRPRSSYLKVVGDFCRWNDRVVFGCDDAAKSEFLNKRKAKGAIAAAGHSQSNLWFVDPEQLDDLGPTLASGGVWVRDPVKAGQPSDPFLFAGWKLRALHLVNGAPLPLDLSIEVNDGKGAWRKLRDISVPAADVAWLEFPAAEKGEWIRLVPARDSEQVTAWFTLGNPERRSRQSDGRFAGLAPISSAACSGGLVRARGDSRRTLQLAAMDVKGDEATDAGYYELDATMRLRAVEDAEARAWMKKSVAIPRDVIAVDAASVLVVDDRQRRWRLPKGASAFDEPTARGLMRIDREVATERDLLSCHGTFYELPAENADGFAKLRPISSHNFHIMDYCSYRGLLILTGVATNGTGNPHIVRSDDGNAAVWAGALDDLWKLGKPSGQGGPWKNTSVVVGKPSDPYLFWGYDRRSLTLTNEGNEPAAFRVEVDLNGEALWVPYKTFAVPAGQSVKHDFPAALQARWLRVTSDRDVVATAWLIYE